jgi:hypothetical protein
MRLAFDTFARVIRDFRKFGASGHCLLKTKKINLSLGCSKSTGLAMGRMSGQGRDGGLAADGRQPRPDPDLQDSVQHVFHAGHLGNGYRLE